MLCLCKVALIIVPVQMLSVLCLGQDFWGDTGVPISEFQGDIYKFWGTHHIFQFFPVKSKLSENFCYFFI